MNKYVMHCVGILVHTQDLTLTDLIDLFPSVYQWAAIKKIWTSLICHGHFGFMVSDHGMLCAELETM